VFAKDEVPEIIKLAQYALTLPLHTCSCDKVFSNQNLIVTRLRSRLNPKISDRENRVIVFQRNGILSTGYFADLTIVFTKLRWKKQSTHVIIKYQFML
jgi:hypothetical protein